MDPDYFKQMAVSIPKNLMLKWNEKTKVESHFIMLRGAACSIGTMAYFTTGGTHCIYCYDYTSKKWTKLPVRFVVAHFTFVVVNDLLTSVGGRNSSKLFTLSEGKWVEKFPPMTTKRENPAAVCTGHSLVVAGGQDEHNQNLPTVEVMDTNTLQWFTAASLPLGVYRASMTACGDDLYLLGDETTRVYSCSLQALLQSCEAPGKASTSQLTSLWNKFPGKDSCVWNRITDLPVSCSTAVTLCGQLVSVGGKNDGKEVDSVYCYDPATSAWKTIRKIPVCKSHPLVTTLPGDKLIIIHGHGNITIDVADAVVS